MRDRRGQSQLNCWAPKCRIVRTDTNLVPAANVKDRLVKNGSLIGGDRVAQKVVLLAHAH